MFRIRGNDMVAKLVALIVAIVLWIYVMNEQNPAIESSYTVPLEMRNAQSSATVVDVPDSVRIRVRGTRRVIAATTAQDFQAYVELKGLEEGRHTAKVATVVPAGLELLEVNPEKVFLRIESILSRQMPVEVRTTGIQPGMVIGKVTVVPEQVTVKGPKSLINTADKVLATVDIRGRTAGFSAEVPVVVLNREGKVIEGLTVVPNKVSVSDNALGMIKKTVPIKVVTYGDLAPGASLKSITTEPQQIEISGEKEELDKLDLVYTEPIHITGIARNSVKEAKLQLKEGLVPSKETITIQIVVEVGH